MVPWGAGAWRSHAVASTPVDYERLCSEIVAQTDLLRAHIAMEGADMTLPVPTCPGWNVGQLVRHLGGGQRWAETIVRTGVAPSPCAAR